MLTPEPRQSAPGQDVPGWYATVSRWAFINSTGNMKIPRLNFVMIFILLCAVGYLSGPYLPKLQEFFLTPYPVYTLSESIISLVFFLALCAISARIILWAYSKTQLPHRPMLMFSSGLLISAVSAFASIWFGFQKAQFLWSRIKDQVPDIPLSTGYINFFSAGFESVFLICGIITVSLLWFARWEKNKSAPATPGDTNKIQDIILIISTLVIYAFSMKSMLEFIFSTLLVWRLNFIR
jgi:hypothetical protein